MEVSRETISDPTTAPASTNPAPTVPPQEAYAMEDWRVLEEIWARREQIKLNNARDGLVEIPNTSPTFGRELKRREPTITRDLLLRAAIGYMNHYMTVKMEEPPESYLTLQVTAFFSNPERVDRIQASYHDDDLETFKSLLRDHINDTVAFYVDHPGPEPTRPGDLDPPTLPFD